MAWVKIDEHFYDHPKWVDAPGDSIALWLAAMAWCNRNDSTEGYVPANKLNGLVCVRNLKTTTTDLCKRGAFHPDGAGYLIHDYVEFQQPEKVKEIAAKRSQAGKKGAAHRWQEHRRATEYSQAPDVATLEANGMANAIANGMAKTCPDTDTDSEEVSNSRSLTGVVAQLGEKFKA